MRVEPLLPDVSPQASATAPGTDGSFRDVLDALGATLYRATSAEDAFARGTRPLQSAIYERARADVALSVATAAAQRVVGALQSVLNMQI